MTPSPSSAAPEVIASPNCVCAYYDHCPVHTARARKCGHCGQVDVTLEHIESCSEKRADSILITREQLKSLEWDCDLESNFDFCNVCGNGNPAQEHSKLEWGKPTNFGHAPDCWLGAALGEKR